MNTRTHCLALRIYALVSMCTTLGALAADVAVSEARKFYPPDGPETVAYTLPDALVARDGRAITTATEWTQHRRPEILELFRTHVYGRVPGTPFSQTAKIVSEDGKVFGGAATRKQIEITIGASGKTLVIHLVLYTPNGAKAPAPAFLLMGNASLDNYDPARAGRNEYWPVEKAIERGYATAAFWSWDLDPDQKTDTGFKDGIHALLDVAPRTTDSWATLAAWAWGMSRCLDYLVTDKAIAPTQVAVVGHSRAGKTALWAAAQDERFAMACSNDSGCGGAALTRRRTKAKETVALINKHFPHWFADAFKGYNDRHDALPVDQHMLLALLAPRAVCVTSASLDPWADPRGEFLSLVAARPVFSLFGRDALGTTREMPAIGEALHGNGAHYRMRDGKHALALSDWMFFLDAADREFARTVAAN